MLARLQAHIEVVTKALVKRTPFAARSSMLGVWIMVLPAQPNASARWSSVRRKMMWGRSGALAVLARAALRAASDMAEAAAPAARVINWRRLRFFIFRCLSRSGCFVSHSALVKRPWGRQLYNATR